MCIILDANVVHLVLSATPDQDFLPVRDALFSDGVGCGVRMVYGGRLRREYAASDRVRRIVAELDRGGRALLFADAEVDGLELQLTRSHRCVSDDQHVVALAVISRARLLCSHDVDLHCDFTDPGLISRPRGKVYQNRTHLPLLRRLSTSCRTCARGR